MARFEGPRGAEEGLEVWKQSIGFIETARGLLLLDLPQQDKALTVSEDRHLWCLEVLGG